MVELQWSILWVVSPQVLPTLILSRLRNPDASKS
jgi:hypothetical protein